MAFIQRSLTLALLLLTMSTASFAQIQATASVSSTQVTEGDIFILTVSVNDTGSEYQFESTALEDDFIVYPASRSQQSSYINGDFSAQTSWEIRLQAKQTGNFTIPSFTLDTVKTDPINLSVISPTNAQRSASNESLFIENTLNKQAIYVDQPVILKSKIFISENITNGDIQPPILDGAAIERIDGENQTQIVRNGVIFQVFTYQYQITPTSPGELEIGSPLLTGAIRETIQRNGWQQQSKVTPINIRGNSVALKVKAMPDNFNGDWLVSEDVRLIENINLTQQTYRVGDPITRSISLQVASLSMDQMPTIKLNYDDAMRYYPDQDDLKQGTIDDLLYSQRTISHAIIANEAGQLTLPAISIPWWDPDTETQQYTTLPAQTLTIHAAPNSNEAVDHTTTSMPGSTPATEHSAQPMFDKEAYQTTLLLWQLATLILLLLLIVGVAYHFYDKRAPNESNKCHDENLDAPYLALQAALRLKTPSLVYACLLRYLQSQDPSVTQLHHILRFTTLDEQQQQLLIHNLQQLERACAAQVNDWNAQELQHLLKQHSQSSSATKPPSLTRLNP